ncbi:MAG: helix-hairpin-helix domain-containing protein [Brumimicrobium sp.]
MKKQGWDNEWVYFSKRARKGVFFLLFIFIIIAILPRIYYTFVHTPTEREFNIEDLDLNLSEKNSQFNKKEDAKAEKKYEIPNDNFNPNDLSAENWQKIGFTEKQAQSIINYRDAIGGFKVKTDLKKLFGMTDELYNELEPKIVLPIAEDKKRNKSNFDNENNRFSQESNDEESEEDMLLININIASEGELQKIKGVGPFFAKEIVKLREKFGGLIYKEQLLVIYNMDEEKLEEILSFLSFDLENIKKININQASAEQLSKHPWISTDLARSIVFFRENYNTYNSLDELLLSPYMSRELFNKVKHYLTI